MVEGGERDSRKSMPQSPCLQFMSGAAPTNKRGRTYVSQATAFLRKRAVPFKWPVEGAF